VRALLLVVAISAGALACGGRDEQEARERTHSWIATARMVADAWSEGTVPTRYARETLRAAAEALRDDSRTDGAGALDALADAVATGDRAAVRAARARLERTR
jgi:hypothetical protein